MSDRHTRPAHPQGRGLQVLPVSLRGLGSAGPSAEGADRCGYGLLGLRSAGLIGALQRRCEQRVGPGSADGQAVCR
jgi:hypothetical protein